MDCNTEYRKSKTLEERKLLSDALLNQHPDKLPIIFEPELSLVKKQEGSEKFKYVKMLVSKYYQMARIKQMLQEKLKLAPDETVFIFLDKKSVQPCSSI